MKITDLEAWLFRYPLPAGFRPSWIPGHTSTSNSAVICRLWTDEGLNGIAGGPTFADAWRGPVNVLRSYLVGLDVDDTREVNSRLLTMSRAMGIRAWFVEAALWDLRGKLSGKSVASMLGPHRDRIRVYASTGELREPEDAARLAKEIVIKGFQGIKIRTRHGTVEEDLAVVAAVRETVGPDVFVMCDANQAWRVDAFSKGPRWDLARATEEAIGMEEYSVAWLEEPLDMYDLDGYAELRRRTKTPIAAGELHGDPALVNLLIEAGGVDIVQPDCVFTGGITGAFEIAERALRRGLSFAPHTWSNGLGLVANLHVALASPNCDWLEFPYDPPGWVPSARDAMLLVALEPDEDGYLHLPSGPGLGVNLDEARIAGFATPI